MKIELSDIKKHLEEHGIRPSVQRIEIMRYMMEHRNHPTVDMIYSDLVDLMPTLSRTTVYNTLWLFIEHRALKMLDVDRVNARFDYIRQPHAHMFCRGCGAIYDVMIENTAIPNQVGDMKFYIDDADTYYKGLCEKCYNKSNNK